jgi:nucleoid-associated protein YgaU
MTTAQNGATDAVPISLDPAQNGGMVAHPFVPRKHLFAQALTRTGVRASLSFERMFGQDAVRNAYPRPRQRRGWGRVLVLTGALLLVSGRLAYGSGPVVADTLVVAPGDTVWAIAASHYRGDPRPHVEEILAVNHLSSPVLTPGQTLRIPRQ